MHLEWNTQFSIFNKTVFEPIHFEPGVFCFYLELKIEPYFPKWCYTNKNKEHNNSKMSLFWNILAKTCLYRILYRPIWTCLSRYGPQSPGLLSADMSRYGPNETIEKNKKNKKIKGPGLIQRQNHRENQKKSKRLKDLD